MAFNALEKRLKDASQAYYTDGTSDMTDSEFDAALNQLKSEKPDSEVVTSVGHGYDVGQNPGKKVRHWYGVIGSLDKCHNWLEVPSEIRKSSSATISMKLDGISCVCYYRSGEFVQAITRGNGVMGIDITDKIQHINGFVPKLWRKDTVAIRGEILMTHHAFDMYRSQNPDASNPRNVAAGLVNRKATSEDDLKLLQYVCYSVVGMETDDYYESTLYEPSEVFYYLKKNNFYVAPNRRIEKFCNYRTDPEQFDALMKNFIVEQSSKCLYPYDGVVINSAVKYNKRNQEVYYESTAYKFPAELGASRVIEVEWNMSKTRYMIPRVIIEPISLSGTTVSACSGFNAKYILDHRIGPGAVVELCKSGEIIPDIQKVIVRCDLNTEILPTVCPECGRPLTWNGVHLECTHPDCSGAALQDLKVWMETIVPTNNFGEALRLKYLERCFGRDNLTIDEVMDRPIEFYKEHVGDSIQDKQFMEFITQLKTSRVSLATAIEACNVPRIGHETSVKLAWYPDYVQNLCTGTLDDAFHDRLAKAIGSANANSAILNHAKFKKIAQLWSQDRIVNESKSEFKGSVAITGSLSVPRKQFEQELKDAGWSVGSLTKTTKFLITDNPFGSSSKNQQAVKYGVPKISEAEFRKEYM